MSEINLNFIRCFQMLSETLNFSEASEKLRLAQSNVSRQIKILEESMGVRLFHRTRQGVSLTQEGLRFKGEVLPLARALEEKISEFKTAQKEEAGEIKLGCFSEVGQSFFMGLCLEFQRNHPGIRLEMIYESENEILEGVQTGSIEFGVLSHPPIIEGLAAFPVMKQKIVMIMPAARKNPSKEEIEDAEYALYEKTDLLLNEMWSKHVSKRKKARIAAVVNSHRSILDAVAGNGFFAALPQMSAKEYLEQGRVKVVPGMEFETSLYLIHPHAEWMPKKNMAFKQYFLKRCKELKNSV